MLRFVPLLLTVLFVVSCGKDRAQQPATTAPQQKSLAKADPAAFVDAEFLSEQLVKRSALRRQIDSLLASSVTDRRDISNIINHRKGELMALKKNLRNSTTLTRAQRDSLIAPLEAESIELATDLIAVAK
ncbi:MAG: hypothetical protein IPG71_09025 [bacterium]|nr:hypothetical protein [bacterium]